jgi:chorismate mutase-like protein
VSDGRKQGIEDWRRKIDEIDRQLIELLNERSHCALEIGRLKRQQEITIYQPDRERQVLENAERANRGPLSDKAIRRLFERVLDEARSLERQERSETPADQKDS